MCSNRLKILRKRVATIYFYSKERELNGLPYGQRFYVRESVKQREVQEIFEICDEVEKNEETQKDTDCLEVNDTYEKDIPSVGMVFASEDEVTEYYKKYARHIGFGIAKISSKNGDDGKKYFTLACSRARKYVSKSKNPLKPNPITKTQCKARLNACIHLNGTVIVSSIVIEHNHELSPSKARYFRSNKNLGSQMRRRLELNDQAGINVSRNFRSLVVEANGYENLTFGEKDCRNYIDKVRRLRLGTGDAEAIQKYFVRKQKQNNQFYYVMDVDDESRLRNVFWADARCRTAYEYFGEVITFDTTYLTNKYDMPFAPFVGVNHHGQSMLLGCALLSNEDTKTFTWLFSTWLECMHGCAPNSIITDQDRAMKNAIETVFPKARHRWCLWHLMKKIPEKFGRYSNYESIKTLLHDIVYDSTSKSDFMMRWKHMVVYYELHDNEWLKALFEERHRWVPIYVRDTFWPGMSTTQRSESMNSFFDGYVNSKTTLKQFVEQYDNALKDKIEKESMADFRSFNTIIACVSHFGFEVQFQKAFTNAKFKEFQFEIASMMYCHACFDKLEGIDSIFCVTESRKVHDKMKDIGFMVFFNEKDFLFKYTCCLFEFKGIVCKHILCVLKLRGKTDSIPDNYILGRWRKDVNHRHTLIKCGLDNMSKKSELQRVDKACDAFYEVASTKINSEDDLLKVMNWIKELKIELACKESSPRTVEEDTPTQNQTFILDPTVTRSKGRPPLKRKTSKVDQIVKKKLAPKKTKKCSQKNKDQEEGISTSRIHDKEPEVFFTSQLGDGIGTQESIQGNTEYTKWMNSYSTMTNLAPICLNQKHLDEINQVSYHSKKNGPYFELSQVQHQMNEEPSL
ncbi:protein FAR1-RELATED SEQUENCE 4-like [Vicia villosa]|uniref:protein FAR1-RELATED SEQUENCE 4-like n=1 Tax=Vicia villosa TaxID=3911 RepID=UPI00273AD151|nr:protein FAR1-RELATED SEQUENCE 4-like [Vicia villosa]